MKHMNKLFPHWKEGMDSDSRDYPYRISKLQKAAQSDEQQTAAFRESMEGMSVKDASKLTEGLADGQMGTGLLDGYQPDVYLDPVLYGARTSVAKRDFPNVPQSFGSSFKSRYMWRHDSVGVYREGENILTAKSGRLTDEFAFAKIADSMVYTREFLSDSTLDQISLDMAMSQNKIAMFEDRLMWHELCYISNPAQYPHWTEYNFQRLGGTTADDIIEAVGDAYLDMTTRLEDEVDASQLRLYMSPANYKTLWKNEDYRRFDILGQSPTQVTGQIPPLFRIPTTIVSPGYFGLDSEWNFLPNTMFLVATGTAAIRMRADTRVEPWEIKQRQMEGWLQSERLRPYVLNPLRYIRISLGDEYGSGSLDIQTLDKVNYKPRDLSKDDANKVEMTVIEADNAF